MSLRSKLTRLGAPAPATAPAAAREPTPGKSELSGSAPGDATLTAERRDTLEELRRRMQALLGTEETRSPARGAEPHAGALEAEPQWPAFELPFEPVDRAGEVLWQRLEVLGPSARVGRVPLDAAAAASPEMLALLGLDPTLAGCDPRRALYLDTETTGLGGSGALAFLVGLCWFDASRGWILEQLLLRSPGDEPALLERVAELVEDCSLLVTFNGKSFDRPLLETRRLMNRMSPLPLRPHLDLLSVGRRLHKRRLGSCRLIHLESEVLGWVRNEEDVPGAEIPSRYAHFLRTGDGEALRAVVDHNAWDVVSMAALVGLYGEPLPELHCEDLVSLARTLRRAGDYDRALHVADVAVANGAGPAGLRARGDIAKARGDKALALRDYEALCAEVDDPAVRLELAKLYEHHLGEPSTALELVEAGTGETELAWMRRRSRLERKVRLRSERGGRR
jgi:uncharacterized protein YprB with RNaseH-like and TPR domain